MTDNHDTNVSSDLTAAAAGLRGLSDAVGNAARSLYRLHITGVRTVPLRTGALYGSAAVGDRAEHARRRRVATWARRRQRRHGIPAAVQRWGVVLPNAVADGRTAVLGRLGRQEIAARATSARLHAALDPRGGVAP